jgi:hypothetical protein
MTWAPLYATAADLRTYMRAGSDTSDDASVYTPALTAASRAIDMSAGRQFGSVASEARVYTAVQERSGVYRIPIDDTQAVATLAVDLDGTFTYATAVTDFRQLPVNGPVKGRPYTDIELGPTAGVSLGGDRYRATSAWGWTAVPATIVAATLLQASRIAKRRDAPFGVAGSPEMGNELRLLAKLDPDVVVMVSAYRRYW